MSATLPPADSNDSRQSFPDAEAALRACEAEESRSGARAALEMLEQALQRHGDSDTLLLKRAQLLVGLTRRAEAVSTAQRAAAVSKRDVRVLQGIAKVLMEHGDPAEAKPLLIRACKLLPQSPAVLYDTALCHFYLNEMDDAAALLDRVLRYRPGDGRALHVRSQLRTQTRAANNVPDLGRVLTAPNLQPHDAMLAAFALAKELEDLGEFAGSFAALRQANRIQRSNLDYSIQDDVQSMQDVMACYSREALDGIRDGFSSSAPIFIVGMPRTGTTLVERMLASHSECTSIGEAMEFPFTMGALAERTREQLGPDAPDLLQASLKMDFAELGRAYVEAVRPLAKGRARTVDKLPFNFRYCGLIHKALSEAKIVHLTRDPMDTCYAVFKTRFINAYHFSYQLDELAEYYVAYRRMMAHWHTVLPGVIYDVSYEQIVADPAAESRRLLQWCGLPWEDAVLDFHQSKTASTTASTAQVRKPIYQSSVAKWRNVASQMQPVLKRLLAAGLVDADGNPPRSA